jgi:hypothetical protein
MVAASSMRGMAKSCFSTPVASRSAANRTQLCTWVRSRRNLYSSLHSGYRTSDGNIAANHIAGSCGVRQPTKGPATAADGPGPIIEMLDAENRLATDRGAAVQIPTDCVVARCLAARSVPRHFSKEKARDGLGFKLALCASVPGVGTGRSRYVAESGIELRLWRYNPKSDLGFPHDGYKHPQSYRGGYARSALSPLLMRRNVWVALSRLQTRNRARQGHVSPRSPTAGDSCVRCQLPHGVWKRFGVMMR